jgi:hypothetical protein
MQAVKNEKTGKPQAMEFTRSLIFCVTTEYPLKICTN